MKKTSFFLTALLGMFALLSSCDKEITSTALTIDESQTATMKFYVNADLDTNDGLEKAPDGTILNISIENDDLNGDFDGDGRWTGVATVTAGVAEITVPANQDGVEVYVDLVAFEHKYAVNDSVIETRIYEYNSSFEDILTGSNNVDVIELESDVLFDNK